MIDSKKKEIVQRGTAFFPIQYYWNNTDAPLYNLPVHWHLDYEIIHVVEGRYKMIIASFRMGFFMVMMKILKAVNMNQ